MASLTARDILTEEMTAFDSELPVDDAIDTIRQSASDSTKTVYYGYVVDANDELEGVVSLRELLNANGELPVGEIATERVVSVETTDSVQHVGRVFSNEQLMALPVVDQDDTLVGIVRADAAIEALDEQQSKDVLIQTIRDIPYDPSEERSFECFECGTVIQRVGTPGECPQCGGEIRHRGTPIE